MPQKRLLLGISLLSAVVLWLGVSVFMSSSRTLMGYQQELQAQGYGPYAFEPLLSNYGRYYEALLAEDVLALEALAEEVRGSFLEYRIMRAIAGDSRYDAARRARAYGRVNELMIRDPLAAAHERQVWLEHASLAETAGFTEDAIHAYSRALPLADALSGIRRLVPDPYRRASIFSEARQHRSALEALGGLSAPHLEAPTYRALGQHEQALSAYRRWLQRESESEEARYGQAISLFNLGRNAEADALFAELPGDLALTYRGHIARRAGNLSLAADYFYRAGDGRNLWALTESLERENRLAEATFIYLMSAEIPSAYQAESAYRAYVLAERLGDSERMAEARALMPTNAYYSLDLGLPLELPTRSALPPSDHPALALANALARAGDLEAAIGELRFAARNAEDEASAIDLAEALYSLGDYRQSQRTAETWLKQGSQDLRTWQLSYPRAYAGIVEDQAATWGVEPHLIWAVMRQESRYYPYALSHSNAQGLMQVIPSTWEWLAELLREAPADPFDPHHNIRYGTYYLSRLLSRFNGDYELTVTSYNGGQGRMSRLYESPEIRGNRDDFVRFIESFETRDYLQQVMLNYHIYNALYPSARAQQP